MGGAAAGSLLWGQVAELGQRAHGGAGRGGLWVLVVLLDAAAVGAG
jgi:hypothetical protein